MAEATPQTITLPYSKAKITFTDKYSKDKISDLTRRLINDEKLAERMRKAPTDELSKVGIVISDADRKKITDEDILAAMGHRVKGEIVALGPVAIVIVIVAVVNSPGPAY